MIFIKDRLVRNIVLSVAGLGILTGAYFLVQRMPAKQGDTPAATATPTPAQAIEIFKYKTDDVKEVYVKNPDGEYTIEKYKTTVKTKDDSGAEKTEEKDSWRVKEHGDIEFSSIKLENAVYDFVSVSADKEMDASADLTQFGLSAPQSQFTVHLNDGTNKTIFIGNKVAGGSGYFIREADSGKVYTVSAYKAEAVQKKLNDYRDTSLATVKTEAIRHFVLTGKEGLIADIRPVNDDEKDKFSMLTSYIMEKPRYESVSADNFGKLIKDIGTITAAAFVEDNPKDLSKYGLSQPVLSLTLADEENSFTIHYGKRTEDNKLYAMLDGKNFVFTQDPTMFETLEKVDTLGLLEKFTHIINIDKVAEVTAEGQGQRFTLAIAGEGDSKTYSVNGTAAEESAFKKAYQEIIGLTSNGFASQRVAGAPDYTITFVFTDGSKLVNQYISYDERNYALDKNGNMDYIILKKNLSAMMSALEQFASDPTKKAE